MEKLDFSFVKMNPASHFCYAAIVRSVPNIDDQEPSNDARVAANGMRNLFVALVKEGFTENQALILLGSMLAASVQRPPE